MGNTANNNVKKDYVYWIKIAIVLIIQISFMFIPGKGQITDFGMSVVGIFIGTLLGWCICDPIWPSISCLILLGLTKYSTMGALASSLFGNPTIVTVLLIFMLGGIMMSSGVSEWAAKWIVSRKILHGRPLLLTAFILIAMFLLSSINSTTVMILLWEVVFSIVNQVNIDKDKNRWPSLMVFTLLYVASIGLYLSWRPTVVGIIGISNAIDPAAVLTPWPYLIYGLIVSVLLIASATVCNFLIYKPDLSAIKAANMEEPPQMTKKIKATLLLFLGFFVVMLLPSILPKSWSFTAWLAQYGTIGTLLLAVGVGLIIRVDGKPLTTIKEAATKGIAWGPIFITGTALVAAGALTSEESGVTVALNTALSPIFSGMSPFAFAATVIILTIILTNFITNIVVASLFIPIVYSLKDMIGIDPFPLIVVMIYSCQVAVMLPSSNPITALMFGNTEKIKSGDIFRYSIVSIITAIIILVFIAYPLATVMY